MKKNIIKKIFIKIAKFLNFELIDQNDFTSPTLGKKLNENLRNEKHPNFQVRFEGMITPLSRGSSFCEDFDPVMPDNDDNRTSPEPDEVSLVKLRLRLTQLQV